MHVYMYQVVNDYSIINEEKWNRFSIYSELKPFKDSINWSLLAVGGEIQLIEAFSIWIISCYSISITDQLMDLQPWFIYCVAFWRRNQHDEARKYY
jgi:hypothetical protein